MCRLAERIADRSPRACADVASLIGIEIVEKDGLTLLLVQNRKRAVVERSQASRSSDHAGFPPPNLPSNLRQGDSRHQAVVVHAARCWDVDMHEGDDLSKAAPILVAAVDGALVREGDELLRAARQPCPLQRHAGSRARDNADLTKRKAALSSFVNDTNGITSPPCRATPLGARDAIGAKPGRGAIFDKQTIPAKGAGRAD